MIRSAMALIALATLPAAALALQLAPPAPAAPNGEVLFRQRCASCHVGAGTAPSTLAPSLTGVVGRRAARTSFATYSPALRASNLRWTRANLDRYLTAPARLVPGTRMVIAVPDPRQRAAIIDYLARRR